VRIALHACCGPCLLEPYDALAGTGDEVLVFYANPNIHPREEYERRRDTLMAYAEASGIRVEELAYDTDEWEVAVAGLDGDRAARCRACFGLRLSAVASRAAELGLDAVATTLTVSPYQDPTAIREAGERVCAEAGVGFLVTDFRDRFPEASRRSRELGMYRQDYCGCRYSDDEAREGRDARRRRAASGGRPAG
jgi:predicted adenine nucleotide alpha hydrolase (AANH) superfamily ATPase